MTGALVLGVDPGSKWCGLALVRGQDDLVAWDLVERPDNQSLRGWVEETLASAHVLVYNYIVSGYPDSDQVTASVEAVTTPQSHINGKLRINSPESLIGTAAVMGAFIAWAASERFPCVLVPPGGNGSGRREGYPSELWGAREGSAGTGKLNHVRSAYDVALAGWTMLAQSGAR
jgi:hypothetical protein